MKYEIDLPLYTDTMPGDPNCEYCGGDGVILDEDQNRKGPPSYTRCACMLRKDILANAERGYRGLTAAQPIPASPLLNLLGKNVWVTASKQKMMQHLRHVAIRQPPTWHFKVATDVDLMSAWLASIAVKGKEIIDADVAAVRVSTEHLTLVDLVVPPELLILRVGVKAARNAATPEVLLEALTVREHSGLTTWVWDTPDYVLGPGHIAYSEAVAAEMQEWKRVHLDKVQPRIARRNNELPDMDDLVTAGGTVATGLDQRLVDAVADKPSYPEKPKAKFKPKARPKPTRDLPDDDEAEEEDPLDALRKGRGKVE